MKVLKQGNRFLKIIHLTWGWAKWTKICIKASLWKRGEDRLLVHCINLPVWWWFLVFLGRNGGERAKMHFIGDNLQFPIHSFVWRFSVAWGTLACENRRIFLLSVCFRRLGLPVLALKNLKPNYWCKNDTPDYFSCMSLKCTMGKNCFRFSTKYWSCDHRTVGGTPTTSITERTPDKLMFVLFVVSVPWEPEGF